MKRFFLVSCLFFLINLCTLTAQKSVQWGYCDNNVVMGIGSGSFSNIAGAIYMPEEFSEVYKDTQIAGLKIGLMTDVKNLEIFITKELGGTPVMKKMIGNAQKGIRLYMFDSKYTIDGKGFYVGYSCTGGDAIGCSSVYNENGCWIKLQNSEWENYASPEKNHNALNISMLIQGQSLPNDIRILGTSEIMVKPNTKVEYSGFIENLSSSPVRKCSIKYSIGDSEPQTKEISTYLRPGFMESFVLDLPVETETGVYDINVELTDIDGKTDDYTLNNTLNCKLRVTDLLFVQRVFVEEATGTWCPYCPRGIVAFNEISKRYPENFIGVAVHARDALTAPTYAPVLNYFNSYPSCMINRNPTTVANISTTYLDDAIRSYTSGYAFAAIGVDAWLDKEKENTINIATKTQFAKDIENANYRLSFVLVEDNVQGYKQNNGFSGGSDIMGGFEDMPNPVAIPMDHVGRGLYDYAGLPNSIPSEVVNGEVYEFNTTIPTDGVQNKENMSVVALLLDAKTGFVVNSSKCHVGTHPSGLKDCESLNLNFIKDANGSVYCPGAEGIIEVYSVDGTILNNVSLGNGPFIVRYISNDGAVTVRKVVFE